MRGSFLLGVLSLTVVFLTGCETVKGVGRDITGASTVVQESFSGGSHKER